MVKRLKVGMIGCGAIAQIQHLPHLRELDDRFEIAGLCDLSAGLLTAVGDEYGVPPERRFNDFTAMLGSDVEAVIVCPSGSHAPASIAAAQAGKHVLVEKPMCVTVREAEAMVAAADAAGVILQVAYMKRHDPAYQYALTRIKEIPDPRFVQINHLHPDNTLHLAEFKRHRFDDLPPGAGAAIQAEHTQLVAEALGRHDLSPALTLAFSVVLGSMIHDIGCLTGAFGPPQRVVSTDIWAEGRALNTVLEYPNEMRAVCSWIDLPDLWDFRETFEVYGSRQRVIISFPTGFSRGLPTDVTLQGMEAPDRPYKQHFQWHDNPFKQELLHFRDSIINNRQPITPGRQAIADIALVRDIILAFIN